MEDALFQLLSPAIQNFIRENQLADTAILALTKPPKALGLSDYPLILAQIKARQKARAKVPGWLDVENLILPAPDLMEQASSHATAHYKASLAQGARFADLTAGAGVDFLALLGRFDEGIAIEKDVGTAEILAHNLKLLTHKPFQVLAGDAETRLESLPPCDLIYCDPQRRGGGGKGRFRLADCSPDITALLGAVARKAPLLMLKTSPVLDIDAAVKQLAHVRAVHVLEWRGDCREVVYLLDFTAETPPPDIQITAAALDDEGHAAHHFTFTRRAEEQATPAYALPGRRLFEPGPAFLKAGCFKSLVARYGLKKLHPATHLYTSDEDCPDFPGRQFTVEGIYPGSGKSLPLRKAHLTLRNFPSSADVLRRKLRLADGGDDYMFACILCNGEKALIHGRKSANATL